MFVGEIASVLTGGEVPWTTITGVGVSGASTLGPAARMRLAGGEVFASCSVLAPCFGIRLFLDAVTVSERVEEVSESLRFAALSSFWS